MVVFPLSGMLFPILGLIFALFWAWVSPRRPFLKPAEGPFSWGVSVFNGGPGLYKVLYISFLNRSRARENVSCREGARLAGVPYFAVSF